MNTMPYILFSMPYQPTEKQSLLMLKVPVTVFLFGIECLVFPYSSFQVFVKLFANALSEKLHHTNMSSMRQVFIWNDSSSKESGFKRCVDELKK